MTEPIIPKPRYGHRDLFLEYRDNFEGEYEKTLYELRYVIDWLVDPERKLRDPRPRPEWTRELDALGQEGAIAKVNARALAHACADTVLRAVQPLLDEPQPTP